jgi:hypothetical protein
MSRIWGNRFPIESSNSNPEADSGQAVRSSGGLPMALRRSGEFGCVRCDKMARLCRRKRLARAIYTFLRNEPNCRENDIAASRSAGATLGLSRQKKGALYVFAKRTQFLRLGKHGLSFWGAMFWRLKMCSKYLGSFWKTNPF